MEFSLGHQIDLLHMARRLWRPLTRSCTLKTVEREILGIDRGTDVASEEIPNVYFHFLRTGEPGLLPLVFHHNLNDVTSLGRMWDALGRLLEGDTESIRADEKALGSFLLARESGEGFTVLSRAFQAGRLDAGAPLGLAYKRRGDWEKAAEIWSAMAESRSLSAAVELAKYLEHQMRDPDQALATVERIFTWSLPLDRRAREELQKRRERLRRKCGYSP
jgi:tetratricopeptide (TPR) repeat protein